MPKPKKDETTLVAQCEVTWPEGKELVKSFDKAWHRMLDLGREGHLPTRSKFTGFVRKDS